MNEKCCISDMISEALSGMYQNMISEALNDMYQNIAAYEKEYCNVSNAIEGEDNGDK